MYITIEIDIQDTQTASAISEVTDLINARGYQVTSAFSNDCEEEGEDDE